VLLSCEARASAIVTGEARGQKRECGRVLSSVSDLIIFPQDKTTNGMSESNGKCLEPEPEANVCTVSAREFYHNKNISQKC
jgi:hypothetical protein